MAAQLVAHLDTHVVVWLYAGLLERIPAPVQQVLEERELRISPMVLLEVEYLYETGRIHVGSSELLAHLSSTIGVGVAEEPFPTVANAAVLHTWTRDPFDRLIVAQSEVAKAELITKDETLRTHHPAARWA